MKTWPRRIRDALLLALTWGAAWAPIGVLVGLIVDPTGRKDEMWWAIGAYPGFLCGVLFSAGLGIAERGRKLAELSLVPVVAWGMLSGMLVGSFPFLVGSSNTQLPTWLWGLVVIGPVTLLSTLSAAGSAVIARRRELRDAGAASTSP